MYPEYRVIQIVELPQNGDLTPYAIRYYGRMEYFDFDFMCKNTLKKWFADHKLQSGDYIIVADSENSKHKYETIAICSYRVKETGVFMDFRHPGETWVKLVNDVMEDTPVIDVGMKIQTINKLHIPKIGTNETDEEATEQVTETD